MARVARLAERWSLRLVGGHVGTVREWGGVRLSRSSNGATFTPMTLDEHFAGLEPSRRLFDTLAKAFEDLGDAEIKVTKTQVAFRRRVAFAYAWVPEKHLGSPAAPLVLSVALRRRDPSPRWKEVVEPAPGRFTHHLELSQPGQIDEEVVAWLREAWEGAG